MEIEAQQFFNHLQNSYLTELKTSVQVSYDPKRHASTMMSDRMKIYRRFRNQMEVSDQNSG